MQPGCAWPSSTFTRECTGKERTSGLQACNLGVNGKKNVPCVHSRKVSEVRLQHQLRIRSAARRLFRHPRSADMPFGTHR